MAALEEEKRRAAEADRVTDVKTDQPMFKPVTVGPASALAEQPMRMGQEAGDPAPDGIGHDPPIMFSDVRAPMATMIQGYDQPLGENMAGATSMAITDATKGYDPPLREGVAAAVALTMVLAKGFDLGCSAALSA